MDIHKSDDTQPLGRRWIPRRSKRCPYYRLCFVSFSSANTTVFKYKPQLFCAHPHRYVACNVADINFTRFTQLKEINLANVQNLTLDHINQLPTSLTKIDLYECNVANIDFSRFPQLEEINLSNAQNLTPNQTNQAEM